MATLTIRMPENKAQRLKTIAAARDISVNKLFEELAAHVIAAFDIENRFKIRAARGSASRGLATLERLDTYYGASRPYYGGLHEPQSPYVHNDPSAPSGNAGKKKKKKK